MTLILSLLTPEFVIQVSDRRLITQNPVTGVVKLEDDESNKAVLWRGRLAFAFTGLADLGTERRTDLWLAHTLAAIEQEGQHALAGEVRDQRYVLEQLAVRCTNEFRRPPNASLDGEMRRQAFVAVGWARFDGEERFSPYLGCVSNLYAPPDFRRLNQAGDEFSFWARRLGADEGGYLLSEGQRLDEDEQAALIQKLGALDHAFPGPDALVQALIEEVHERAEEPASSVGKGLLVNVLPRASIVAGAQQYSALLGAPLPDQQTFLYVRSDQGVPGEWCGPVVVGGGAIMADFKVGKNSPEPEPEPEAEG